MRSHHVFIHSPAGGPGVSPCRGFCELRCPEQDSRRLFDVLGSVPVALHLELRLLESILALF